MEEEVKEVEEVKGWRMLGEVEGGGGGEGRWRG